MGSTRCRQPGAHGIGQDHSNTGATGLEKPADPRDGPTGPDTADERPDLHATLRQNLRPGRFLVDARVGGVGELVGQEPAALCRKAPGDVLKVLGRGWRCVRYHDDVGPNGSEGRPLIGRHLLGHHADEPVAPDGGHKGEAHAGISGRRLDKGSSRSNKPVSFGVVKDGKRDAVLDTPAGVQELTLAEDWDREPGRDVGEAHHRRAADTFQDRRGCVHPRILPPIPSGVERGLDPVALESDGPAMPAVQKWNASSPNGSESVAR